MRLVASPAARFSARPDAFTLIEIVVAIAIVAVIAAVAIPTLSGINRDEQTRAPMKTLAEVVQEARQRAMRERKAYQIVFEREGIHASPQMFPYEKRDEFLKYLEEMRTPPKLDEIERVEVVREEVQREDVVNARPTEEPPSGGAEKSSRWEMPWTVTIPLEQGTECEVLMWGDAEWELIEGEMMRRWVFQPTGMLNPARVRIRTGDVQLEGGFDLLTGELTSERTTGARARE